MCEKAQKLIACDGFVWSEFEVLHFSERLASRSLAGSERRNQQQQSLFDDNYVDTPSCLLSEDSFESLPSAASWESDSEG